MSLAVARCQFDTDIALTSMGNACSLGSQRPAPLDDTKPLPSTDPAVEDPDDDGAAVRPWYQRPLPLTPVTRKSAHELTAAEEDRILAAWLRMMRNEDGPGTSRYFRLALIHGGSSWPSTHLAAMQNPVPSYCTHGVECFPNWHRIYMLEFEQTLRRADLENGGDGNIGLPYWDWTRQPEGSSLSRALAVCGERVRVTPLHVDRRSVSPFAGAAADGDE